MLAKPLKDQTQSIKDASLDDSTLWLSFKKGNDLAFSVLYNKYVHRLYNYGMHTCRNKELVLDCLQELFTVLWDRREKVSDVTCVNYYLFKSFRRLLMNRLTLGKKFLISLNDSDSYGFDFSPSTEEALIEEEWIAERNKKVRNSLNGLTKRQREAIFLKFFNQLSYHEVAAVMDLHVDSVYNLISKSIDVLRRKLKADAIFLVAMSFLAG
jgi:RNA polymerase sigma factor (sigma-70 family)